MIHKLSIKNFLGIKSLEVTPDGKLNVITGANQSGKTSILKAIEAAFKGRIGKDIKIVHLGEERGEIMIELDDIVVNKVFTKASQTTKVSRNGMVVPKPQEYLDGIVGDFSFNPIQFANLKEDQKTEYLMKVLDVKMDLPELEKKLGLPIPVATDKNGLDLIDEVYQYFYELRRDVNRDIATKEKFLQESLATDVPEFDPIKLEEEKANRDSLIQKQRESDANKEKLKTYLDRQQYLNSDIEGIDNQIKALLQKKQEALLELEKVQKAYAEVKDSYVEVDYNTMIEQSNQAIDLMNQMKVKNEQRDKLNEMAKELDNKRLYSERLNTAVEFLDKDIKQEVIKNANLPIKGLKYDGGRFLIDGKNFENLSGKERLMVSLEIAKALNKEFKIICIDEAESLDNESFKLLTDEIKKDEYQFFITNVHAPEANIVMENGQQKLL